MLEVTENFVLLPSKFGLFWLKKMQNNMAVTKMHKVPKPIFHMMLRLMFD